MLSRRNFVLASVVIPAFAAPLSAKTPLNAPQDTVLLRLSGAISNTNAGAEAHFDRDMLREVDWQDIETYTPFTEGRQVFSGPRLSSLLEAVGAQGSMLEAYALNDYMVRINRADVAARGPIVAMEQNGTPMRIRDKGPLWIIFPGSAAEAEARLFANEMIWQLSRIAVV